MLENIAIYGLALIYMLAVSVFALGCVHAARWIATKLEDMLE